MPLLHVYTAVPQIANTRNGTYSKNISAMSPIVINMPTIELLAGATKNSFV